MKKFLFSFLMIFLCGLLPLLAQPQASVYPWPLDEAEILYNTSVRFVWVNETVVDEGEEPITCDLYFGEASDALTKINDDAIGMNSYSYTRSADGEVVATNIGHIASYLYTPSVPLTVGKTYYWRVDAGATQSAVWSFTVAEAGMLIDIGYVFHSVNRNNSGDSENPITTPVNYPSASGVSITPVAEADRPVLPQVVNEGTEYEMTFTTVTETANVNNDRGVYFPNQSEWPTTPYYRGASYVEATLTGPGSDNKIIKKVIINGTDAQPNGTAKALPTIAFSDVLEFDANSIIEYKQVELGICRSGISPEIVVEAPEDAKSFRLYVSSVAGHAIGGSARVTYIGAIVEKGIDGACIDPMPTSGVSVRLHPSVKLSWKIPAELGEVDADAFEVYAGESTSTMAKLEGKPIFFNGAYNITYTPATPFISENNHFWRVDAVIEGETVTGTTWRFKPVAIDEDNLVDIGRDYDGVSTASTVSKSGQLFGTATTAVIYKDTNRETSFEQKGSTTGNASDAGVYLRSETIGSWRFTSTDNDSYIDVALTSETSAVRNINKVVINGTNSDPNGQKPNPIVLFSDNAEFDADNVIGYQQVTLGLCRTGNNVDGNNNVSRRGIAAIVLEAPAGTKSVRVYNRISLSKTGNTYKIEEYDTEGATGATTLSQASQTRVAYLGIELEPSASDNTIKEMFVYEKRVMLNHADGTATVTLANKVESVVEFTLNSPEATADFVSGNTHNFAEGPLVITVTAGDGSTKQYTVTVNLQQVSSSPSKKVALVLPNSVIGNIDNDSWTSITQAYGEDSHKQFMKALEDHEVTYVSVEENAGATTVEALLQVYEPYDLIMVHPTVGGNNTHMYNLRLIVGEKPFLNLKPFSYSGSGSRWEWNTPSNPGDANTPYVNVAEAAQKHPLFKNISFGGADSDELLMYNVATTKSPNNIQRAGAIPFTGSGWNKTWDDFNYRIAFHQSVGNTQMHELRVNEDPAVKYLLIGMSTENDGFVDLSDDAIQLLKNAISYIADTKWYFDYENGISVDEPNNENIICDFQFHDDNWEVVADGNNWNYVGTTATENGGIYYIGEPQWSPTVKLTGAIVHQRTDPLVEGCGTRGGMRINTTAGGSGANADHSIEIVFDEPEVSLLRVIGRTMSGSTDAIMKVQGFKYEDGVIGDRIWNDDTGLRQNGTDPAVCGLWEKEDIEGPFLIRITRTTGGSVSVLNVYAERPGAAVVSSDDATLKSLTASRPDLIGDKAPVLVPEFDPEITDYTVSVDNRHDYITLTAVKNHNKAMFTGDGLKENLVVGDNNFEIVVTAEDLMTKKTYNVNVNMWALKTVTITLDPNGLEFPAGTDLELKVIQFDPIPALPVPIEKEGVTFQGWTTEDGRVIGEELCDFGADVIAVTLYAKYTVAQFTVNFDSNTNGELINPGSRKINAGDPVGQLPPAPDDIWNGKAFGGWNEQPDGSGNMWTAETAVTGNVTLYAVWNTPSGVSETVFASLNVYPNPANEVVTVSGLEGGEIISIFDASGRLVLQTNATGEKEDISLGSLTKGTYLVKIARGAVETAVKLVVN